MGFGLMGAGAAVKGLVGGYQQGRKFAQDEERFEMEKERFGLDKKAAEQVGRLRDAQIEGVGLANRRTRGELDDDDFNRGIDEQIRGVFERYQPLLNEPAAPAATQPQALAGATPTQIAPDGTEVQLPAASGSQPSTGQQQAPQRSRFEILRDMNQDILDLRIRKRGANHGEILRQGIEGAKFFSSAQTQTTIDAMRRFQAGEPPESIFASLRKAGVPVQDGTQLRMGTYKDPDSGFSWPEAQIALPDGRVISETQLALVSQDPQSMLAGKREMGRLFETRRHHAAVEQNYRDAAERDARQHRERMAELASARQQRLEEIRLRQGELDFAKVGRQHSQIESSVVRLVGLRPLSETDRLKLEEQDIREPRHRDENGVRKKDSKGNPVLSRVEAAEAREAERANAVFAIMSIGSMNIDQKTGMITATPAELMAAFQTDDPKAVKKESDGRSYVSVGGRKIYVPDPPGSSTEPPPAPGGSPSPASPAPARPGVTPPPTPSSGVRSSSQVSDDQLREAFKRYGAFGWKEGLLGARPGIRNQAGVAAWDREAQALSERLNTLMAPKPR